MVKSNQRITKIKRDPIEELLKKAEATPVENACTIQPQGVDLTPYPDMNNLRLWVHDYLLNGLNATYINNIDASGQTYLTTIVDGLPLFTKLTKSSYLGAGLVDFNQPTLDSNGVIGGASFAVTADSGMRAYLATNSTDGYWQSNSDTTNHYIEYYNPEAIKLSSIEFNNYLCTDSSYIPTNFIIQGSNTGDASDWISIQTIENSNTTVGTNSPYSFDVSTQYSYKYFRMYINSPQSTVQIGYMKLVGTIESSQVPVEITKPGLWLSNLCKPYQVSYAGGWLRQNLINHSNKEFDTINSDTIGNYSFSFFQRGIIHRDAGSTHADNDSYCQHWSPSALGCISHDSIIIPTNNLRNTYTSYQTLAVPSNVNMQYYSETPSKDVEFTFVDNNDNIPLTTTSFNGRVVGDGWTFEYLVSGNHQGSGTWNPDAGCDCDAEAVNCEECPHCWSCVSEDIRNSGLCITGEIKYQNADGTVCIQAVNECFQTIQASLQPDNPNTTDVLVSSDANICVATTTGRLVVDYYAQGRTEYWGCGDDHGYHYPTRNNGTLWLAADYTLQEYSRSIEPEYNITCNGTIVAYVYGGETVLYSQTGSAGYCNPSGSFCEFGRSGFSGGLLRCGRLKIVYSLDGTTPDLSQPQSNVNVYFCVTDEKKKQEAQGIPWNYTCGLVDRFSFSFSTTQCEDDYTKSYLVAENISISSLGDITGFNEN